MGRVLHQLRWSLKFRGVAGTVRVAWGRLRRGRAKNERGEHPFDLEFGVDTGGLIGGGDLAVGHRHDASITGYAGVAPSRLRASLEVWRGTLEGQDLEERYTFVDVGCGKGRALLVAAERGFREVVGVELNPALAKVAELNAERWRRAGRARSRIRVLCTSAVEFPLPKGDCVVFLYNPFGEEVMREFVQRLLGHDGAVDVLYQNAEQDGVLTGEGLERLWMMRLPISEEDAAADPAAAAEDVAAGYRKARGERG